MIEREEFTAEEEWISEVEQSMAAIDDLLSICGDGHHALKHKLGAVRRHLHAAITHFQEIDEDNLKMMIGVD